MKRWDRDVIITAVKVAVQEKVKESVMSRRLKGHQFKTRKSFIVILFFTLTVWRLAIFKNKLKFMQHDMH
jgi:hypothetical protein